MISLFVAGGYIIYLTRQEDDAFDADSVGMAPSESYNEDEFYRASGLPMPPPEYQGSGDYSYGGPNGRGLRPISESLTVLEGRQSDYYSGGTGLTGATAPLTQTSTGTTSLQQLQQQQQQQLQQPMILEGSEVSSASHSHQRGGSGNRSDDPFRLSELTMPFSVLNDPPEPGSGVLSSNAMPSQQQIPIPASYQPHPLLREDDHHRHLAHSSIPETIGEDSKQQIMEHQQQAGVAMSPLHIPGFQMQIEELDDYQGDEDEETSDNDDDVDSD